MAEHSENVYKLLNNLLEAYTPTARQEVEEIRALARELEGEDFELMPWDFSYYAEKLKTGNSVWMKKRSDLTLN